MRRILLLVPLLALALGGPAAQAAAPWTSAASVSGDLAAVYGPQPLFTAAGDGLVGFGGSLGPGAGSRFALGAEGDEPGTFGSPDVTTTTDPAARLLTYGQASLLIVSQTSTRLPHTLRARIGAVGGRPRATADLLPGVDTSAYAPAIDDAGHAVVAAIVNVRDARRPELIRRRELRVVRRPAVRPFARAETIAGRGNPDSVAAAVGDDGELVVAWEASGRVRVRTRVPGGHWSPVRDLGPGAKGHTQITADAHHGRIVIAWFSQALSEGGSNGAGVVRLASRPAGAGAFTATRTLDTFTQRAPGGARVLLGLDAGGAGVVGWTGRAAGHWAAKASVLDGASAQALSDPATDAVLTGLAVGPDGTAAAAWIPPPDTPSPVVTAAVRVRDGDRFGAAEPVSDPLREVVDARVAVDPTTDQILAAWRDWLMEQLHDWLPGEDEADLAPRARAGEDGPAHAGDPGLPPPRPGDLKGSDPFRVWRLSAQRVGRALSTCRGAATTSPRAWS